MPVSDVTIRVRVTGVGKVRRDLDGLWWSWWRLGWRTGGFVRRVRLIGSAIRHWFTETRRLPEVIEECARCREIELTPWRDLILLWNPNREPTEADGEAIRALALKEHAAYGHPTEADYHR